MLKFQVLVDLCGSVRTLPVSTVLQTVRQVLKSPPSVAAGGMSGSGPRINVEVSTMQFFYNYLARCSAGQVYESWSALSALLRDCLALAPPALFLALSVLNQFVLRSPALSERKEQKELQDVAGKLIEACAAIGGSCLEQTTWLRYLALGLCRSSTVNSAYKNTLESLAKEGVLAKSEHPRSVESVYLCILAKRQSLHLCNRVTLVIYRHIRIYLSGVLLYPIFL